MGNFYAGVNILQISYDLGKQYLHYWKNLNAKKSFHKV